MTDEQKVHVSIQEVKDVIVGVNELSVYLISLFQDGIQAGDFVSMWDKMQTDAEFKALLMKAYDGVPEIKKELQDLDVAEAVELVSLQASFIPKFLDALKKE